MESIETAPYTVDENGWKWLKWCLLFFPDNHGGVWCVGGMDADMWLTRDYDRCCSTVPEEIKPTHWMALPEVPTE